MTYSWASLPAEVLCIVFSQINDLRRLASFRLVCKAWNPVAERAMFSQKLILHNRNMMIKFCNRLSKKPHLGRLVRYLDFGSSSTVGRQHPKVVERIIKLAFTPNIEVVTGTILDDCYRQMLEAAIASKKKYSKIRHISWPEALGSIHAKIIYEFRLSLESLTLRISPQHGPDKFILDRLATFSCLTRLTLHLQKDLGFLIKLENTLRKCPHLKGLVLDLNYPDELIRNQMDIASWMTENVVKCSDAAIDVSVRETWSPEIVEYICHKYPKASNVSLRNCHRPEEDDGRFCRRICKAIRKLQNVNIGDLLILDEELAPFMKAMKSKNNSFSIYEILEGRDEQDEKILYDYDILVDARKCISTETTHFSMGGIIADQIQSMIYKLRINVTRMDVERLPLYNTEDEDEDEDQDKEEEYDDYYHYN